MKKLLALLLVPLCLAAQEHVWKHHLDGLGNATGSALVSPGADQSDAAIALTYTKGPWTRFNLPRFKPVEALQSISFQVKQLSPFPKAILARVLTDDGIEWHTTANMPISTNWQTITLTAKDFTYYRGGPDNYPVKSPDFASVVQLHLLPDDNRRSDGSFAVDNVRFLPDGPHYTFDKPEWITPPDPVETEYNRLADLHQRLNFELKRLAANRQQLSAWLAVLQQSKDLWPTAPQQALKLLQDPARPWLFPNSCQDALAQADILPPFQTFEQFRQGITALENTPPVTVTNIKDSTLIANHILYEALTPDKPQFLTENGVSFVRQHVTFTNGDMQTLFLDFDIPNSVRGANGLLDAANGIFKAKIRCTAKHLLPERPFLLRVSSSRPDNRESFSDILPQTLPTGEWQELSFNTLKPLRGSRPDTSRVYRLSLRVENIPGTPDDFDIDVQPFTLHPQPALNRLSQQWRAQRLERLKAARLPLLELRTKLAALEESLRDLPDLRQAYLQSFTTPLAPLPAQLAATAKLDWPVKLDQRIHPQFFISHNSIIDQHPAITVTLFANKYQATQLRAAIITPDGTVLADSTAAVQAGDTTLTLKTPLPCWLPLNPNTFTLALLATRTDQSVAACDARIIGFRTAAVRQSGLTTLLRHTLNHNRPDWFYAYNGQPYFIRVAANSTHTSSLQKCPDALLNLDRDLWTEGNRFYGMHTSRFLWHSEETLGTGQLGTASLNYKSLTGWQDIGHALETFELSQNNLFSLFSSASPFLIQVGNEVELDSWGAQINTAFPGTAFQPLDVAAQTVREKQLDTAPVMYVRAGSFRLVEPLPHEDVSGINQYTGRYGGHIDEVARDLAELAAEATLFNRPLAITEWNGPKYSWASGGIGGCTLRGAAYYLEKYWRAMIQTPGIIGSSEFTLNWVFAPFEDITNQTREEAFHNRPRHSAFGGGRTAGHVPLVEADNVVPDDCYRSMQAFHSPLYIMANTPGTVALFTPNSTAAASLAIINALRKTGKSAGLSATAPPFRTLSQCLGKQHTIVAMLAPTPQFGTTPQQLDLGAIQPLPPNATEASIQTIVNPASPDHLLTVVIAPDEPALNRAMKRLQAAAENLADLAEKEINMPRFLALIDRANSYVYDNYVLNQAARGFAFLGDDVRISFDKREFLTANGGFRPAWSNLHAIFLDVPRALSDDELAVARTALSRGVNLVLSRSCLAANPTLCPNTTFTPDGTFAQPLTPVNLLAYGKTPIPLKWLGNAELDRVAQFAPKYAKHNGTKVSAVTLANATPLAVDAASRPVLVLAPQANPTDGRIIVLGWDLGDTALAHWRTTHGGKTHGIYDRDTACGLERPTLAAVNAALIGQRKRAITPDAPANRLRIQLFPESMFVRKGQTPKLTVRITDNHGRVPASVQLNGRTRLRVDNASQPSSPYFEIKPEAPGVYTLTFKPTNKAITYSPIPQSQLLYQNHGVPCKTAKILSVQLKAFAGFDAIPDDSACAFILED